MKKIISNRIIWITLLALIIFASFSVIIMNFVNVRMMGDNLAQIHLIYQHSIEEADSEEDIQQIIELLAPKFDITVTDLSGVALASSNLDEVGQQNFIEESFFRSAINDKPKIAITNSERFTKQSVVLAQKFSCRGGIMKDLVLIIAMPVDYNNALFIIMVPVLVLIILVVLMLTAGCSNNLVKNAVSPLNDIHKHLEDINRGVYKRVESQTKFQEVRRVVNEINTISSKISNNIKTLDYERQKSRFILDNMSQGIVALSRHNNVLLTNKASLNILGSTKNLLNSNLRELIDDKELIDKILEAIENKSSALFEHKFDENYYKIEIICMSEVEDNVDREIENLLTFTNITSEIMSAKVRSEFFANASHELRTPLTAIRGFTELYDINPADDARDHAVNAIRKNADKVLALIEDMLKLSRAESNLDDENVECIDLKALADSVISKLEPLAIEKKVIITCSGSGDMYGSSTQIEEVLTNLIDNGIKYNIEGGSVKVEIENTKKFVKLIVSDTGIGIESKHQSRVFERFYRVDKGRSRKVKSTGLGLAIVKHIVLSHSGTIELESKLNKGTKFTIIFPNAETTCERNE